jgi:5-methylcytosine-specific restriction endonuclease McrA
MGRQSHAEPAVRHNVPPAPRPLPSDHVRVRYGTTGHVCARCGQTWPCTFLTGADQDAHPHPREEPAVITVNHRGSWWWDQ